MDNYNDFFTNSDSSGSAPDTGFAPETKPISSVPVVSAEPPVDEEPLPGHLREDASSWDRLTDGQRKLIVFGILFAVMLVLVLLTSIFGSCGDCSLCAAQTSASDVADHAASDSAVVDVPVSETDSTQQPEEENDSLQLPDAAEPAPSASDISAADDDADRQAAQGGFLSACSHEADNEAGSGDSSSSAGFLSFLFGCTGCADSCTISCADSLTDPVFIGEEDPDRDNTGIVSVSDADEVIWPHQPDDSAYIAMLSDQLTGISEYMIQLGELELALSQYTDPQRIRDNDRFRAMSEAVLTWCKGAEEYSTESLTGQQAINCNALSVRLAGKLRTYIEDYPLLVTGATSGTDIADKGEQINGIMADIVELYAALNTPVVEEAPEE